MQYLRILVKPFEMPYKYYIRAFTMKNAPSYAIGLEREDEKG